MRVTKRVLTGLSLAALAMSAMVPGALAQDIPSDVALEQADAAAAMAAATQAGGSRTMQGGTVRLEVGRSHVINDVESYEISNPGIVEPSPTAEGDLILNARGQGSTTVLIRKQGMLGLLVYNVEVSGVDVDNVLTVVKAALGGIVGLQITKEGNVVVLQGDVQNRDDGVRIDRQKDKNGDVLLDLTKRTYMAEGLKLIKEELAQSIYRNISAETALNRDGEEVLMLRGTVYSDAQKERVLAMAGRFFEAERISEQLAIDPPQVEVDIEVYTFDLSRLRQLGNNGLLSQITSLTADGWEFQTGPLAPGAVHTQKYPFVTLAADVETQLDALNDIGYASNISKQHASVRSGQVATIKNITEKNVVLRSAFDSKLEQIEIGQTLEISPVVLEDNRFETGVNVDVSQELQPTIDPDLTSINVARRSLKSSFMSGQSETIVLGGNKLTINTDGENSTPFLAHIPIVNWWFRAKSNSNSESVQVFFMTLFAPMTYTAEDEAQSLAARDQKQDTIDRGETNVDFLQRRQRWEAEGIRTLITGESRYQ